MYFWPQTLSFYKQAGFGKINWSLISDGVVCPGQWTHLRSVCLLYSLKRASKWAGYMLSEHLKEGICKSFGSID